MNYSKLSRNMPEHATTAVQPWAVLQGAESRNMTYTYTLITCLLYLLLLNDSDVTDTSCPSNQIFSKITGLSSASELFMLSFETWCLTTRPPYQTSFSHKDFYLMHIVSYCCIYKINYMLAGYLAPVWQQQWLNNFSPLFCDFSLNF